jgi:23S rRNA pseudouridine1911/1915/1917 synthase
MLLDKIKILYEDDMVVAIDKPADLLVHPDGSANEPTLVDWILKNYPEINGVGETQTLKDGSVINRPGIVHRLDRETSGVMLIAKTLDSYINLKKQFQDREIKKAYLALCYGEFKDPKASGVIDKKIGRSPSDFRRWSAQPGARGNLREAITEYFLLEQSAGYSLLFCQPLTGRTHQIRVHLKAIHHPIVCDKLYAPKNKCPELLTRHGLHARAITWTNQKGQLYQIKSELPNDFGNTLQALSFKYQSN